MSQIKKTLEFARQQRRIIGQMEAKLSELICILHEADSIEGKHTSLPEGSMQTFSLGRALNNKCRLAKQKLQEYNAEFTRLDSGVEAFSISIPESITISA